MVFYIIDMKENKRICEIGNFVGYDDFNNKVYSGDIVGFYSMKKSDEGSMYPEVCGSAIVIGEKQIIIIEKNYNGKIEVLPKGIIKSYKDISYDGYKYLNSNYCINEIGRIIKKDDDTLELTYGNTITIENDNEYGKVYFYTEIDCEPQYVPIDKDDIPEVIKFLQSICDKENSNKISNNEVGD